MPHITAQLSYNGFDTKVARLGLISLLEEVEAAVTGFQLAIKEARHANGTRQIRESIDAQFSAMGGWKKIVSGGVDWSKENDSGSIGVEVQVSGRSDLLAVDVLHLKKELTEGRLDAGVIVVPDDDLSPFLTDRTPNLRTAIKHVDAEMAVQLIAFRHDAEGPAIPKAVTNRGKGRT